MKLGTGGSSGAHYLASTLARPAFSDLWEIRSSLESRRYPGPAASPMRAESCGVFFRLKVEAQ
jgi:hypothetical protein